MNNSQKEFDKYLKKIHPDADIEHAGIGAAQLWQAAWDARGKFDEDVCDSLEVYEDHSNEIRKRGGE